MTEHKKPEIMLRGGLEPSGWFGTRTLQPGEVFEVTLVSVPLPSQTQQRLTKVFSSVEHISMIVSDKSTVTFRRGDVSVSVHGDNLESVRLRTEFPIDMVAPLHAVPAGIPPFTMRRVVMADLTRG